MVFVKPPARFVPQLKSSWILQVWHWLLVALLIVVCFPDIVAAQAFVERLSPPVIRRGMVTRVEFTGTEVGQALGVWTSIPNVQVRAHVIEGSGTTRTVLDLELPTDAPLGIYGLRLATRSGLSNLHLFAVDELPIEVRDASGASNSVMAVSLPVDVVAACKPATIDRYSIKVSKDQRVALEVIGNRLGQDYDPVVQIRSASGKLIAECDHSVGLLFDCRFAHRFNEAGTFHIDVRDSRYAGHPMWNYVLRLGDFPEARMAVPSAVRIGESTTLTFPQMTGWQLPVTIAANSALGDVIQEIRQSPASIATWVPVTVIDAPVAIEIEPNNTKETATAVIVPVSLNGVFDKPGDRDWFSFELAKDQKLNVQGVSRAIGSASDLELVLFDADGHEVRRIDDTELDEGGFALTAGKAGIHRLQVRELARDGGPDFAYRIDIQPGGPQFQLFADIAELTVPQGSYQAVPFKVTRTEFSGEIQLELRGAPVGMRIEPSTIPANTSDFAVRIIADPTTPEGLYSLQVAGTGKTDSGATIQTLAKSKPLVDRQLKNVDLIPYALRDDQRLLPPSVTDKIALMVVPETPFTVELPESTVLMPRFQTAEFPIVTARQPGFTAPITFTVSGGQIGDEQQERNQVYARFTPGTVDRLKTSGVFHNRINTQLLKYRVDLTASSEVDGRRINLVRTFTLDVRSAFQPACEPAQLMAEPGGSVTFKILANRVPSFDGAIAFNLGPQAGFVMPSTVEIPTGQPSVDVEIKLDATLNPGRHAIRVEALGYVGKFEESLNLPALQIEVKKTAK